MTKTQVNISTKSPEYTALDMAEQQQTSNQPGLQKTTCWYVWGIISTIFCCFPCGVIGLVHAMIAKHEAERGNFAGHRRRLYQAKCWISWSITLGLLLLLGMLIYCGIVFGWFYRAYGWCTTIDYDDWYYNNGRNFTDSFNSTDYEPYPVILN